MIALTYHRMTGSPLGTNKASFKTKKRHFPRFGAYDGPVLFCCSAACGASAGSRRWRLRGEVRAVGGGGGGGGVCGPAVEKVWPFVTVLYMMREGRRSGDGWMCNSVVASIAANPSHPGWRLRQ